MSALSAVKRKFVLHWGEMGARWGINRTVAQIHALLFVSEKPLHAEAIAEALEVARSNVSNSLRELQGWGIIKVVHVLGDRRDHFESMKDVWEMFRTVIDERKRREVDPTVLLLRECVVAAEQAGKPEAHTKDRLADMLEFFEQTSEWYDQMRRLPCAAVMKMAKLGAKIPRMLGLGS